MVTPLHRLVYASTFNLGRVDHAPSALRRILSSSKRNNAESGITGFLIFDGDTFLQVLEGPKEDVVATFARIEADDRHRSIDILGWQPADDRSFRQWAMEGYLRRAEQDGVFRSHGIEGKVRRQGLKGEVVLSLARELAQLKFAPEE